MPLDGEEHAGTKAEHLEHYKDYGDPIDHFDYLQGLAEHGRCFAISLWLWLSGQRMGALRQEGACVSGIRASDGSAACPQAC